jgi:hypothetical protein
VFQGAVELRDSSNPLKFTQTLQLAPHQGAISNLHGTIQSHPINFHKYVHLREFDARLQAEKGSAYHRWLAYKFAVQRDPSLVAHYTFEKDPVRPHLLINAVSPDQMTGVFGEADSPGPAPIWAIGRWPQKESLDFNWISNDIVSGPDHLPGEVNQEITTVIPSLVNVPTNPELNIAEAITLAVWIKCPSFEKGGGGPILTNRSKSKVNYQIHFGLGGEGGRRTLIRSMGFARYDASLGEVPKIESREVFFDPDKWHHVVITHDNQMVVYYLDGQLYDRQPYVYKSSAVAEDLIIGGWHGREFGLSGRPFSGKIDEIMIFNRVLSENEVKAMYEQSKP